MRDVGMSLLRLILGLMLLGGIHEYAPPTWGFFGTMLALLLLLFLVTFVHELGHALAARWQRGTILEVSVFGLTWSPGRRRLSWKPLPQGGDIAGFVHCLPPEEDWTRRQHAIVVAAGPLADAMLALMALAAVAWLSAPDPATRMPVAKVVAYDDRVVPDRRIRSNLPSTEEHERIVASINWERRWKPFEALPSMLMVVAFVSALSNLLPYRGSDGARLIELWRGRNRFARPRKVGRWLYKRRRQ